MHPFEYTKAESINEAVELCSADPGRNRLLAGGTDLLTEVKEGVVLPRRVVDLGGIEELRHIRETDEPWPRPPPVWPRPRYATWAR